MTDKKTEELNEQELDQVTGGVAETSGLSKIGDLKPGLTKAGKRAIKGAGIRVSKGPGIRAKGINAEGGGSGI